MDAMPIQNHLDTTPPLRPRWLSLKRGFRQTCPSCGRGRLFGHFLQVNDACPSCGEELHHQRADDAPAYFTVLITGHVIVLGVLWTEQAFMPPLWLQAALWLPALLLMSLWLLPRIKGALIAYQWAVQMHGFGGIKEEPPRF
ncbi:MAG: DUF983 domain-containing protein [Alphaproteobacteria bacterium]|nr:DUF983 domain-containing protein [Alphaproteobacteria bacterium]